MQTYKYALGFMGLGITIHGLAVDDSTSEADSASAEKSK